MNKKTYLLAVLALPILIVSCKSTQHKTETRSLVSTHTPIVLEPKFVDYNVNLDKKAVAMVEGKIKKDESVQVYVNKATAQAAFNAEADFLFEPTIEVERKGRKRIKVVASGYPAKYSGFRKTNMTDSLEVQFYENQQMIKMLGVEELKSGKKKKRFLIF